MLAAPPPPPPPAEAQLLPLEVLSALRKSLQLQLQALQDDINKQLDVLQSSVEYQRSTGLQVLDAVQTALAPAMPRLAAFQESSTNMFASAAAWAVDSFRTKGKGKGAANKGAQKGKGKSEEVESDDDDAYEEDEEESEEDEPKVRVLWQGKAGGKGKNKEKKGAGKQGGVPSNWMQAAQGSGKGWPGKAQISNATFGLGPTAGSTANRERPSARGAFAQAAGGARATALTSSGVAAVALGAKAAGDAAAAVSAWTGGDAPETAAAKPEPQEGADAAQELSAGISGGAAKSAMSTLAQTAEGIKSSSFVTSGLAAVGIGVEQAGEATDAKPNGDADAPKEALSAGDAAKIAMSSLSAEGIKASALFSSGLAAAGLGGGDVPPQSSAPPQAVSSAGAASPEAEAEQPDGSS